MSSAPANRDAALRSSVLGISLLTPSGGATPALPARVSDNPVDYTPIISGNACLSDDVADASCRRVRDITRLGDSVYVGGIIDSVTDRQILKAYRMLASEEGVFVEPASAASVAGLLQAHEQGVVRAGSRVVCTVTGNGLKDPDWAISGAPAPATIPVDATAAAASLGLA